LKNVDMTVEGNILTIKVDLSKEFGPSSSGKTIIIASTEGNVSVADRDEKVGLNDQRQLEFPPATIRIPFSQGGVGIPSASRRCPYGNPRGMVFSH